MIEAELGSQSLLYVRIALISCHDMLDFCILMCPQSHTYQCSCHAIYACVDAFGNIALANMLVGLHRLGHVFLWTLNMLLVQAFRDIFLGHTVFGFAHHGCRLSWQWDAAPCRPMRTHAEPCRPMRTVARSFQTHADTCKTHSRLTQDSFKTHSRLI